MQKTSVLLLHWMDMYSTEKKPPGNCVNYNVGKKTQFDLGEGNFCVVRKIFMSFTEYHAL